MSIHSENKLLKYIHSRFRTVFGEPYSTLAMDSQWTLKPHPDAPAIFILVNGSHEKPATWVFDPYHSIDNVWRNAVTDEKDVDSAIALINTRLANAVAVWGGDGHNSPDGHNTRDGHGQKRKPS